MSEAGSSVQKQEDDSREKPREDELKEIYTCKSLLTVMSSCPVFQLLYILYGAWWWVVNIAVALVVPVEIMAVVVALVVCLCGSAVVLFAQIKLLG